MRHDQDRETEIVAELHQQLQDLAAHRRVEVRDRLVGDDDLGLEHECAGDHHALALSARQLVRVAQEEALGRAKARARERSRDELFFRSRRSAPGRSRGSADPRRRSRRSSVAGSARPSGPGRPSAPCAVGPQVPCGEASPSNWILPPSAGSQPHDRPCRRRLAAPRLAGEREHLALADHAGRRRRRPGTAWPSCLGARRSDRRGPRTSRGGPRPRGSVRLSAGPIVGGGPRWRSLASPRSPGLRALDEQARGPPPVAHRRTAQGSVRCAVVERHRASRVERTSRGDVLRIRRVAAEAGGVPPEPTVADRGERGGEGRRVRVLGLVEDRSRPAPPRRSCPRT